jgi:hypothetical protein
MARPAPDYPIDDVTVYLVEEDFGQHARGFVKTDAAEADRETIIRNLISGQYSAPLRVIAFNTAEGWSRDASEDIANEVFDRAFDADEMLADGTKRFRSARDPGREATASTVSAARRQSVSCEKAGLMLADPLPGQAAGLFVLDERQSYGQVRCPEERESGIDLAPLLLRGFFFGGWRRPGSLAM